MDVFERWKQIFVNGDDKLVERYFNKAAGGYNEPWRHYHNLQHVEQLLNLSERFKHLLKNQAVVDLAIFYHDVVYRPGRNDNEMESAVMAEEALGGLNISSETIACVKHYILATQNHFSKVLDDSDLEYFLDFDLSILSSDAEQYEQYAKQIRQEYTLVTDAFYNAGRIEFLDKTLQAAHLYYTPEFRKNESKARSNMEWEIEMLKQG